MFLQNAGRIGNVPKKKFLYSRKGPWPQPSPTEPLGTAPEVLHLPWQEVLDFQVHIGLRYMRDLFVCGPAALVKALGFRELPEIPDDALASALTRGLYSRFLSPLDPADLTTFGVDPSDGVLRYKIDFSPIASVDPYEGMYVAPTITLLRREGPTSPTFAVEAVAIGETELVLRPGDGPSWELAKYFVLQGCSYGTLFTEHPNVHFPYDTINAITKGSIPTDHLLFQLLHPHLRFSLVLDNSVLQSPASVISEFRHTIYDPFTARASDGLMSFFIAGYKGIRDNAAYPGYRYAESTATLGLPPTDYGRFLESYFGPFHWLTQQVVAAMDDDEMSYCEEWARWIRVWIESFPELHHRHVDAAERQRTREKLAFALAVMLWDVTVVHSTDHHDFATDIPVEWKCFRLRVPPPVARDGGTVDRGKLSRRIDLFKSHLAHRMFFAPTTVTKLIDTEYDFGTDALRAVHNEFIERLRRVDADLPSRGIKRFIPLGEIAASIQY
ncbi:hypothetical protein [Sandaracinus amylolyticus]|uniref:hypothetical protein n=1 Tax=Sandaracinus amylolyticus TaxID=927083 RepID=UPI001F36C546|nr:hypothetical protein [Sandaracinus amylolyticus]